MATRGKTATGFAQTNLNIFGGYYMDIGKTLMILGALILITGIVIFYALWLINWFGKLPGDIHIKNANSTVFIPITSIIIISLVLSIILNLFFRK